MEVQSHCPRFTPVYSLVWSLSRFLLCPLPLGELASSLFACDRTVKPFTVVPKTKTTKKKQKQEDPESKVMLAGFTKTPNIPSKDSD